MKISFSIPGRPAGWQRPIEGQRSDGSFYRYNAKEAEASKLAIAKAYRAAAIGARPTTGPVKMTVIAVFAIPPSWTKARREEALNGRTWHVARGQLDLDNAIKLVGDALNKIAYVDDAQISVLTCAKRYGHPERTEITIEALPQTEAAITPGQSALEARVVKDGWDAVLAPPPPRMSQSKAESGSGSRSRGRFGRRSSPARPFRGFPRDRGGA